MGRIRTKKGKRDESSIVIEMDLEARNRREGAIEENNHWKIWNQ